MDNIFDRLKKHGISQDRYDQQSKELLYLGFSEEQTQKIVIKKSSNNTVETLITYHHKVSEYLSHKNITGICSKDGGGKTLLKVITSRKQLNIKGFSDQNIVAIASNIGGSITL